MVRLKTAAAVLLVTLASCSSTYRVKKEDLTRVPEVIPAVAQDGRETWISSEAIKNPRETELPAYVDVDVSDTGKILLATGGGIAAYGLLIFAAGFLVETKDRRAPGPDDGAGKGSAGFGLMSLGGALALTGGSLALAGFLASPPDQPTPTTAALPPARR